ncbi:MAG: hypothetical protein GY730_08060 [bacterium]|nr:hypothetical protein [bacterium]
MIKIAHRINTIHQLKHIPIDYGVELDLRSEGNQLILHHDPFETGENFEDYLSHFRHNFIILNTKSEGLESRLLSLMKKHNIQNYFFLDLSLPFLIKYAKKGVRRIAVRYSQYEPLEFVSKFKNMVDWVWVDCFNGTPPDKETLKQLKDMFKVCLVSPELQGFSENYILDYKRHIQDISVDAVCTKKPELWT